VVETYGSIAHHFHRTRKAPWPEMRWFTSLIPQGSRVADIGCGTGRNSIYIAAQGHMAIGIDIVPDMVSIARKSIIAEGLEEKVNIVVGDARSLPWDDSSMDGAICVAALHHIPSEEGRSKALMECWRVIRPGGHLLVSVWAREQDRYPSFEILQDPGDVLVSWKRDIDGAILKRYYHLYTRSEFEDFVVENIGCGVVFSHADNHQLLAVKDAPAPEVPAELGGDNARLSVGRRC